MTYLKLFGHLVFVLFLTMLTQIGGLVWILGWIIAYKFKKKKRFVFPILYLTCNLLIVPPIAIFFGRAPLPVFNKALKPRNWIYPLLFRNYVNPVLGAELKASAERLYQSGISITYLDANFPFIDGFPLLPHLSHNDGKKIDLSFMYLDASGNPTDKKPSRSGYGVFVDSQNNLSLSNCLNKGYWQYDFTKHLSFGKIHNLSLDQQSTSLLIKQLLSINRCEKIFIEPHLKQSLGLNTASKIRFHGCQAVRHDDHIHLQIK